MGAWDRFVFSFFNLDIARQYLPAIAKGFVTTVYLALAVIVAGVLLGLMLALLPTPVYTVYRDAPRVWDLSALADQQLAGTTMAAEQAVVFFTVFAFFLVRFLQEEELAGAFDELKASRSR